MEESQILSRSSRRSFYSVYQSDYETAAEDSDSSLYHSVFEDENKENDSDNSMNSHTGPSIQRSLLEKCFKKNLNSTPRNEFNKRVSFNINPFLPSTTAIHSPAMAVNRGIESMYRSTLEIEDGNAKKTKNGNSSDSPKISNSSPRESIAVLFGSENISTSDVTASDQSLNTTIVENFDILLDEARSIQYATVETTEEAPISQSAPIIEHIQNATVKTTEKTLFGQAKSTSTLLVSSRGSRATKLPHGK